MSKQGMKRPEYTHVKPKNDVPPVPEIQGKAKLSNVRANPIISGTSSPSLKTYHSAPHSAKQAKHSADTADRPISEMWREIDTDLARDNLENNIPDADLQDL